MDSTRDEVVVASCWRLNCGATTIEEDNSVPELEGGPLVGNDSGRFRRVMDRVLRMTF
jgi:hypothetical protein